MRLAMAVPSARPGGADDAQRGLVAVGGRGGAARGGSSRVRRPACGGRARIAGALATVSRQPNRPQWHSAPSGSTTMWPISPAPSPSPVNSSPSRTRPAPMPRPDLDRDEVPRPVVAQEEVRREGRRRGCRWRRRSGARSGCGGCAPSGRSAHDEVDRPADRAVRRRRCPGVPTPMPRIGWCGPGEQVVDQVVDDVDRGVAVGAVEVAGDPPADLAAEVDEAGGERPLAEVEGHDVRGRHRRARPASVPCRRCSGRGRSRREALRLELADQLSD